MAGGLGRRDLLDLDDLDEVRPMTEIPDTPTRLDRVPIGLLVLGWIWASPITILTLLVILLTGGAEPWRTLRLRDRFLECVAGGGLPGWIFRSTGTGAAAWGTLVPFRTAGRQRHPDTRQHEAGHIVWWLVLGPFGPIVYVVLGVRAVLTGRRFYRDNPLEEDAREAELEPDR